MSKGKNDIMYSITFVNVIQDLIKYSKPENIDKESFETAISYLKNKINIDRFCRDSLKQDLKSITNLTEALSDSADFNEIMPEKYKKLQIIDKQIQTLESVLKNGAKKEDIQEAVEFFKTLSDGYSYLSDKNRYSPFMGAFA